jgi:hypothetical protein
MGNKATGGPFAPLVRVTRQLVGQKEFNKLRGKAISLHSQVRSPSFAVLSNLTSNPCDHNAQITFNRRIKATVLKVVAGGRDRRSEVKLIIMMVSWASVVQPKSCKLVVSR